LYFVLDSLRGDLYHRFVKEQSMRKKYLNALIEMQGNIRVFTRIRPLSESEINNGETNTIKFIDQQAIAVNDKIFEFDKCFDPNSTQGKKIKNNLIKIML
jgi:hypothetical protein